MARRNSQASVTVLHERPPLRDDLAHALTLSRQLRQLLLVPLQCGRHNRRPVSLRVQEMPTEPETRSVASNECSNDWSSPLIVSVR